MERLRFLQGKVRNVVYYWSIDDREYKQYLHVVRDIRAETMELLLEFPDNIFLQQLFEILGKKPKSKDVGLVIHKLSEL